MKHKGTNFQFFKGQKFNFTYLKVRVGEFETKFWNLEAESGFLIHFIVKFIKSNIKVMDRIMLVTSFRLFDPLLTEQLNFKQFVKNFPTWSKKDTLFCTFQVLICGFLLNFRVKFIEKNILGIY